jgi:DNA-binding transcriptional LysR family regulator
VDRLAHMQAFVAVAEEQGFGAAARRLGVSAPVVTRAVAALEKHLGAVLLERTTRKVHLTEVGSRYLSDCKRLLTELEDVEAAVSGEHAEPRGLLGVTASIMFGRLFVAPLLTEFLVRHPQVNARALLVDQVVDLMDEGIDVAVRIAKLSDSTLTSIRVGAVRRVMVASPAFLAEHGAPKTPRDLAGLRCFAFSTERSPPAWTFEHRGKLLSLRTRPTLLVNTSEAVIDAALAGVCITRVLSYMVAEHVRAGRLRVVLSDYEAEPIPVHVIHREGRRAPGRVRAFVDYVVPRLRANPAVNLRLRKS